MFTYKYETRYGDYKSQELLKVSSLMDMIQDISTKDSERCGYGIEKLKEMNLAWLMQGINLRIIKPIKPQLPLEISTAVKTLKGTTSARGCIISQEGERVAQSMANWFLFDTANNKVARVPQEMVEAYDFFDTEENFADYRKLALSDDLEREYSIKVSNKEIDTNLHLNNQKGAELLMDALPFDFYFSSLNVLYKKQAFLGQELSVLRKKTDNGYHVQLQNEAGEICVAGAFENIVDNCRK